MNDDISNKNTKLVKVLVIVVIGMFGFGFALVPLYNVLCEVTGLNGKIEQTAVKETTFPIDEKREITVEFLTMVNEKTPLKFSAEAKQIKVHPGQYYTVKFYAKNLSDKPMVARAIPSISPGLTTEFFNKTECFCFNQQTFKAKEAKEMPVRFAIDPKIPGEYKTITLAYTFFDNTNTSQ